MAEFQFTKDVNASKLLEEIKESGLGPKFQELRTNGDLIFVFTNTDLTASEQTTLNNLIATHTKTNDSTGRDRVKRSILFGIDLQSELAANFLKRNLTNTEIQTVSTRFATFQQFLYGGYIEAAKAALPLVLVDTLVPQQLIDQMSVKMQRFIDAVKNG